VEQGGLYNRRRAAEEARRQWQLGQQVGIGIVWVALYGRARGVEVVGYLASRHDGVIIGAHVIELSS
jgi:hypothetical protein